MKATSCPLDVNLVIILTLGQAFFHWGLKKFNPFIIDFENIQSILIVNPDQSILKIPEEVLPKRKIIFERNHCVIIGKSCP